MKVVRKKQKIFIHFQENCNKLYLKKYFALIVEFPRQKFVYFFEEKEKMRWSLEKVGKEPLPHITSLS